MAYPSIRSKPEHGFRSMLGHHLCMTPDRQNTYPYVTVSHIMTAGTRVEVWRSKNESSSALIRRFTRRAQDLGLVREVRDRRYWGRSLSKNVVHKRALISKTRRENYNELVKLGKIDPAAAKNARKGAKH
jgi:hypothetical protein